MIVTTEAIVLRSMKYRDTSKLVSLYTAEFGRCSVIANGARRAKNKFGSALEPMACSTVTFYKSPNKDLHTLSAAETSLPLRNIMESFDCLTTGMAMLELVYASQLDEEQNTGLYALLRESLRVLNDTKGSAPSLLASFQMHLAAETGFAVDPTQCPESGEEVLPSDAPEFVVSLADGAPFSPVFSVHRAGLRVDADVLAALQMLYSTPLEESPDLHFSDKVLLQLRDFFGRYFEYHLGKRIGARSMRFLHDTLDSAGNPPNFSA